MIRHLHSAAHLRCDEGRVEREIRGVAGGALAADSSHISGDAAAEAEGVDLGGRELFDRGVPRRVGIASVDGKYRAFGNRCAVPASGGVEGNAQTSVARHLLEGEDVLRTAESAAFVVLILQLHGDDWAALAPHQSLELLADLLVVGIDVAEIGWVVGALLRGLGEEPVGEASVANLRVRPVTDAGYDIHSMLGAELDEAAQVLLSRPIPLAFDLFVVDPDDVSGDDLNAGGLHLEDLVLPLGFGHARVVNLAHDRQPGLSVQCEILRVQAEEMAVGRARVRCIECVVCRSRCHCRRCRSIDDQRLRRNGLCVERSNRQHKAKRCSEEADVSAKQTT